MSEAFSVARQELRNRESNAIPLVIVVTDGMPDSKITATQEADKIKSNGIKIAAIGAGDVDHGYLSSLALTEQDYYPINNMSGLADAFKSIINALRLNRFVGG